MISTDDGREIGQVYFPWRPEKSGATRAFEVVMKIVWGLFFQGALAALAIATVLMVSAAVSESMFHRPLSPLFTNGLGIMLLLVWPIAAAAAWSRKTEAMYRKDEKVFIDRTLMFGRVMKSSTWRTDQITGISYGLHVGQVGPGYPVVRLERDGVVKSLFMSAKSIPDAKALAEKLSAASGVAVTGERETGTQHLTLVGSR